MPKKITLDVDEDRVADWLRINSLVEVYEDDDCYFVEGDLYDILLAVQATTTYSVEG